VEEYEKGNENALRKILIPGEVVSDLYQKVEVKEEEIERLFTGKPIFEKDLKNSKEKFEKGKIISVFSKSKFIGMYEVLNEKEIFAKPKFVLQPIKV
jgi:tRNA U55 pseudouridine synthase TruB